MFHIMEGGESGILEPRSFKGLPLDAARKVHCNLSNVIEILLPFGEVIVAFGAWPLASIMHASLL